MFDFVRMSAAVFALLGFVTSAFAFDVNDLSKGIAILNQLSVGTPPTPNTAARPVEQPRAAKPRAPRPSSAATREIQTLLARLGYDPGPADGLVGRRTAAAIRAFERDRGLAITGAPGARVLANLREAAQHGAGSGTAAASSGPSFDCRKATTSTELAICGSDDLAELDRAVARNYAAALDVRDAHGRARLQAGQRDWMTERDRCGADVMCLVAALAARSQALVMLANAEDAGPEIPISPVPSPEPGPGASTTAGQAILPAFDAIEQAEDPRADIAAGSEDRPRFFLTNHFTPREDASALEADRRRMVTRLEYAADPGAMADDKFLMRLLDTLPDDRLDELIGRIYPGDMPDIVANNIAAVRQTHGPVVTQVSGLLNEFDRHLLLQEGRAMVERELPHDQVPNPLEVDLICSVSFGVYDFDTKAFEMLASSCREGRLDVTGASLLTEYRTGPSVGPILKEVTEARAFSERLGANRQVLVSTPARLSVDKSGPYPKLLIEETGAPVLHPMQSLDEVLYRYPVAEGAAPEVPETPDFLAATEGMHHVPAAYFALRVAPDVLSEEDWLSLTERQIEYDQHRNDPAVFAHEKVADRQASFAAPELVEEFKDKVGAVLSELDTAAVARMEVMSQWVDYRDGKLTSSEPWGYLRELYQDDRQQAMASELGAAAMVADPGLLERFNVQELPRSLVTNLPLLVKNVKLIMDRRPRIPEIGMEPSAAEELFVEKCRREKLAMDAATGADLARAHDGWNECISRANELPKGFVIDLAVEFAGAKRWAQGIVLETRLKEARLYNSRGRNFASLDAAAFPKLDALLAFRISEVDTTYGTDFGPNIALVYEPVEMILFDAGQGGPVIDPGAVRFRHVFAPSPEGSGTISPDDGNATAAAGPPPGAFAVLGVQLGDDFDTGVEQLAQKVGAEQRLHARTATRQAALEDQTAAPILDWEAYHNAVLLQAPESRDMVAVYHEPPVEASTVTAIVRTKLFEPGTGPSWPALRDNLLKSYPQIDAADLEGLDDPDTVVLWDAPEHRAGDPFDAQASACQSALNAAVKAYLPTLISHRRARDESKRLVFDPRATWADAEGAETVPSLATPLSMPRLFGESASCPPHEVMALIMLYGDDGRVVEYRQAVTMPAHVAAIAERRKPEAAEAAEADFDL